MYQAIIEDNLQEIMIMSKKCKTKSDARIMGNKLIHDLCIEKGVHPSDGRFVFSCIQS